MFVKRDGSTGSKVLLVSIKILIVFSYIPWSIYGAAQTDDGPGFSDEQERRISIQAEF